MAWAPVPGCCPHGILLQSWCDICDGAFLGVPVATVVEPQSKKAKCTCGLGNEYAAEHHATYCDTQKESDQWNETTKP